MTRSSELAPGVSGMAQLVVSQADTALAQRSGDVPVLATPRVVALCEEASCNALEGALDPGTTSVGSRVEIDHSAPTAPGSTVTARAEIERVEGRKISFLVSVEDARGVVATGRIVRALVNRESFMARLA